MWTTLHTTTTKEMTFNIVLLTSIIWKPMSLNTYNIGFQIIDVKTEFSVILKYMQDYLFFLKTIYVTWIGITWTKMFI